MMKYVSFYMSALGLLSFVQSFACYAVGTAPLVCTRFEKKTHATSSPSFIEPRNFAKWKDFLFTRPQNHRSDNFRYIVHGVVEDAQLQDVAREMAISLEEIHLIKEPSKIFDNPVISSTLTTERNPQTYGLSGLILQISAEHILGASQKDLGIERFNGNMTEIELLELRDKFRQRNQFEAPENLIRAGETTKEPNEVVITPFGPTTGNEITVGGYFIKTKNGKPLCSEQRLNDIKKYARLYHLPIVEIEE